MSPSICKELIADLGTEHLGAAEVTRLLPESRRSGLGSGGGPLQRSWGHGLGLDSLCHCIVKRCHSVYMPIGRPFGGNLR